VEKEINLGNIIITSENVKTPEGSNVFFGFESIQEVVEDYSEDGWRLPTLSEMKYFSDISSLNVGKFHSGSYLMEDSEIGNFSYFSYNIKKRTHHSSSVNYLILVKDINF
jgi:hypothetical protein